MNRTKRAYWILGASLLALVAVCVYVFVVSNSKDDDKAQTTALLDETDQSPRVQPLPKQTENGKAEASDAPESASQSKDAAEAEGAQASDTETGMGDLDEEAREYDRIGQVGEPPEGWKEDYSHWDSGFDDPPIQMTGVPQRDKGGVTLRYEPTELAAQRREAIEKEVREAAEKGLLSKEPKEGFVRREFDGGADVVYAAGSFIERYDALITEGEAIHESSMVEKPSTSSSMISMQTYTNRFHENQGRLFEIRYYRRSSDGSLMREVAIPSGEVKRFVAGAPPDLSDHSESEISILKKRWAEDEAKAFPDLTKYEQSDIDH